MADLDINFSTNGTSKSTSPKVAFFSLKNDGDEAIVRFNYGSVTELSKTTIHTFFDKGTNKWTNVDCLKGQNDTVDACPICKSGTKPSLRSFIQLIVYTKDAAGNVVCTPSIWNAPGKFANSLSSYITEYGDLRDCLFKLKRVGSGTSTTYSPIYLNPMVYKDDIYKKDFSVFVDYSPKGKCYKVKSFEDLQSVVLTGALPATADSQSEQSQPSQSTPVQAHRKYDYTI